MQDLFSMRLNPCPLQWKMIITFNGNVEKECIYIYILLNHCCELESKTVLQLNDLSTKKQKVMQRRN